jgi:hypothetical protein
MSPVQVNKLHPATLEVHTEESVSWLQLVKPVLTLLHVCVPEILLVFTSRLVEDRRDTPLKKLFFPSRMFIRLEPFVILLDRTVLFDDTKRTMLWFTEFKTVFPVRVLFSPYAI